MESQARLYLDLGALRSNAQQALARANQAVMAVVKNDAYHFGLKQAVFAFYEAGIRFFVTTSMREAIQIRQWLSDVELMLINPSLDFESLRRYQIQATLPSLAYLQDHQAQMQGIIWHLEWAGLMRRSGCRSLEEAHRTLEEGLAAGLKIEGLWTHFAWADELIGDYEKERTAWLEVRTQLTSKHGFTYIHAQNSASFVRENGPFYAGDFVRLGIYLYGCLPYENAPVSLAHAVTLEAQVIGFSNLGPGQSAGYSAAFTAGAEGGRLALINIGYGDGLLRSRVKPRTATQGYGARINSHHYPLVALMMSHCFALVDDQVKLGDWVVFYDQELPVHHFTAQGVGANSEQISALNHSSLDLQYLD